MKKLGLIFYSTFTIVMPSVICIDLSIRGYEWHAPQIILMVIIIVCGLSGGISILQGIRASRKLRVKHPGRNERSNLFVLPYGDEVLLTDGTEIIAHLPNKK